MAPIAGDLCRRDPRCNSPESRVVGARHTLAAGRLPPKISAARLGRDRGLDALRLSSDRDARLRETPLLLLRDSAAGLLLRRLLGPDGLPQNQGERPQTVAVFRWLSRAAPLGSMRALEPQSAVRPAQEW